MNYKIAFYILLALNVLLAIIVSLSFNAYGIKILRGVSEFKEIIAMLIVVAGWMVTYIFNNNVQDKRLKNDIMNTARKEITQAVREYQDWLNGMHSMLLGMRNMGITREYVSQSFEKWNAYLMQNHASWNTTLEDYEILFPETKKLRVQLQDRNSEIGQILSDMHARFLSSTYTGGIGALEEILHSMQPNVLDYIMDQICLMVDLNVYLQNKCLGKITGNAVPQRRLRDSSLPILTMKDGLLEIHNNVVGGTELGKMLQRAKKENNYPY